MSCTVRLKLDGMSKVSEYQFSDALSAQNAATFWASRLQIVVDMITDDGKLHRYFPPSPEHAA